jgi:hypothetical protein
MTRTMYDSINPSGIPAGATMVAGYVDGRYANMAGMAARFPSAVRVPIAVFPSTNDGTVLDVETGDATPAQAPGWVTMRRAAGVDPTVYCNADTWPSVRSAFTAAGVPEPHYWIAQYDGVATVPAGAVAKQYESTDPWDLSAVADYWPGVDPAPITAPAGPAPTEEDYMDSNAAEAWFGQLNAMLWGVHNDIAPMRVQLTGLVATVTTLTGLLGQQHPDVDTAQVVAAVQAAIAQATVNVHVDVAEPPAKPAG